MLSPMPARPRSVSEAPEKFKIPKVPKRDPNSLLPERNSLMPLYKFPVPLGWEFGWKLLISPVEWTPKSDRSACFGKIPCIFPC
jgi:hypothetical protein